MRFPGSLPQKAPHASPQLIVSLQLKSQTSEYAKFPVGNITALYHPTWQFSHFNRELTVQKTRAQLCSSDKMPRLGNKNNNVIPEYYCQGYVITKLQLHIFLLSIQGYIIVYNDTVLSIQVAKVVS